MFRKTYIIIGRPIKNKDLDFENEKGSAGYHKISQRIFDEVCDLYDATDIDNEKK